MRSDAASRVAPRVVALLVAAAGVFAGVGGAAVAQETSAAVPGPEALVADALARNPSLAALEARRAGAREMIEPAGSLPDPMAEAMYTEAAPPRFSVGEVDMSMIGVEVRQALPWPGKREAARRVARAQEQAQGHALHVVRRMIARDVRTAYARIYAVDRELEQLDAAREMIDLLAATTAARYSSGQAPQEAVIKARLTEVRLSEQADDRRAERRTMVAMLGRLLDRRDFTLPALASLPEPPEEALPTGEDALAQSAGLAARRAEIDLAQRRLDAARLDLKPNLTSGASIASRGALDPVVTLRFGVEWPLWRRSRQEPMIRAAERELEGAQRELAADEAMLREGVERAAAQAVQARAQVRRYREGILPLAQSALAAARTEYLNGQGDFGTVIDDFTMWLDARSQLARREADLYIAWATLRAVTGSAEDAP